MTLISADWASLALRLVLGITFVVHGYPKLKDLKGTAGFLGGLGFKPGIFWALILGIAEFVGGLALLAGFATKVAGGALVISMTVATLLKIFKWKTPFTKPGGEAGWEWDLVLLGSLVALFLLGAGNILAVDSVLNWVLG